MVEPLLARREARVKSSAARKGERRQQALVDTARRLLEAGEFEDASIAELARRARISRSSFYFYFESKHDLMVFSIGNTLDRLKTDLLASIEPAADAAVSIENMLTAAARLWLDERVAMVRAEELAGGSPAIFERLVDLNVATGEQLMATVFADRTQWSIEEHVVRDLLWMCARSFFVLARDDPSWTELEQRARELGAIWKVVLQAHHHPEITSE